VTSIQLDLVCLNVAFWRETVIRRSRFKLRHDPTTSSLASQDQHRRPNKTRTRLVDFNPCRPGFKRRTPGVAAIVGFFFLLAEAIICEIKNPDLRTGLLADFIYNDLVVVLDVLERFIDDLKWNQLVVSFERFVANRRRLRPPALGSFAQNGR